MIEVIQESLHVKTTFDKELKPEKLSFRDSVSETTYEYEIYGQTVDRSYEDRTVYFNGDFLKAEDAIKLGQCLIKHATNALMSNMINHQLFREYTRFQKFLRENRVQKVILTMVDPHPSNYGEGFHKFRVTPIWIKGKEPQYYEDFEFEIVQYFSPNKEDYEKQLKEYGGHVEFVGYNHDEEVLKFKESAKKFE